VPQPVIQWMPLPATLPGVPAGLAYLTQVDQLLVHQLVEILEGMYGANVLNNT